MQYSERRIWTPHAASAGFTRWDTRVIGLRWNEDDARVWGYYTDRSDSILSALQRRVQPFVAFEELLGRREPSHTAREAGPVQPHVQSACGGSLPLGKASARRHLRYATPKYTTDERVTAGQIYICHIYSSRCDRITAASEAAICGKGRIQSRKYRTFEGLPVFRLKRG